MILHEYTQQYMILHEYTEVIFRAGLMVIAPPWLAPNRVNNNKKCCLILSDGKHHVKVKT